MHRCAKVRAPTRIRLFRAVIIRRTEEYRASHIVWVVNLFSSPLIIMIIIITILVRVGDDLSSRPISRLCYYSHYRAHYYSWVNYTASSDDIICIRTNRNSIDLYLAKQYRLCYVCAYVTLQLWKLSIRETSVFFRPIYGTNRCFSRFMNWSVFFLPELKNMYLLNMPSSWTE